MEKSSVIEMGLLEDRILRIIELKQKGLDDAAVALELGLDEAIVKSYDANVRESLRNYAEKGCSLRGISRFTGFSEAAVNIVSSYYGIELGKKIKVPLSCDKNSQDPSNTPKERNYKSSIARIKEAIQNGAKTACEISKEVKLTRNTVITYLNREKISINSLKDKTEPKKIGFSRGAVREERIELIKKAVENGAKTAAEILRQSGLTTHQVYYYSRQGDVKISKRANLSASERKLQLEDLAEDAESIEKIAGELGMKPLSVYELGKRLGVKLPPFKRSRYDYLAPKRDEKRDRLIKKGLSLNQIAKAGKLTRESIRQYIVATGQHEIWRKSRENYKEEQKFGRKGKRDLELSRIAGQVIQVGFNNASEEDRNAFLKTQEYFSSFSRFHSNRLSFEKLFNFFKGYSRLKDNEGFNFTEFAESFGLHYVRAYQILRKVNLKPPCGNRKKLSKKEFRCYERALEIPMPVPDIAYFSGYRICNLSFYYNFHRKRLAERQEVLNIDLGHKFHLRGRLNYRLASEVYQAEDLGFSKNEILDLFDMQTRTYDVLHEKRGSIAGEIIDALKILNPRKKVTKPYKDW